ncbi:MAG TPA: tyrosine-type recombinase/integrase [Pyrinomonadaceae bacterium]|nr:tyrosine-type recombinase/integrase [Pyrinomonadaceae bacterium]
MPGCPHALGSAGDSGADGRQEVADGWPALRHGMRISELLRLRVKDIDFAQNQITVREGKGDKDRVTMLPWRPGWNGLANLRGKTRYMDSQI